MVIKGKERTKKKRLSARDIDEYNMAISAASLGVSTITALATLAALMNRKGKNGDRKGILVKRNAASANISHHSGRNGKRKKR